MRQLVLGVVAAASLILAVPVSASTARKGGLSIPALSIFHKPVYASPAWMDNGPFWHFRRGPRPGQGKVMVIGGHDVTPVPGYGRHGPFYDLVKLRRGDLVEIWWLGKIHKYRVRSRPRWHPENDYRVVISRGVEAVWFYTCWPRYTAKGRLWVEADAVEQPPKT